MTTHEINLLIERYLDGETTPAEERALALAVQREDRPAEWAIIAEMLGELTLDEAIYDEIMAQRAPKPAKRLTKLWPWAAAACVAIAFVLSYNIIKEEPQETAKVGPQETTKVEPQETAKVEPQETAKVEPQETAKVEPQETTKVEPPLLAKNAPSEPVLSCDWSHDRTAAPPHLEPLPEIEPQLIAEAQEPTPQPEDLALYMALLTEVEARAFQAEQSEQRLYQAILDELLANIQQQSNRPELSL